MTCSWRLRDLSNSIYPAAIVSVLSNPGGVHSSLANMSTLNQHRNNVDCQLSSKLFQPRDLVENKSEQRSFDNLVWTTLTKQCWRNVDGIRCFKVNDPMFAQHWYLVYNVNSTCVHWRCLNVNKTTLKQCWRCFVLWFSLDSGSITRLSYVLNQKNIALFHKGFFKDIELKSNSQK